MTVLPITPSVEDIDPNSLTYICLVDSVSVSSFSEGKLKIMGDGHLIAYITSDSNAPQQVMLLKFYSHLNEEKAALVLVSRSKAWLQDDRTLMFPRLEGGLWRIDCSESNDSSFQELQDVLTFFIKYENRHQMKNTLATINPASCEVTKVIANNVSLDRTDSESVLGEEDFITSMEAETGQKLPVYVDHLSDQENLRNIRKVKLLYQSGNAMVAGSDLLAHAIVLTGQALAKGISSGGKMLENKIEPSKTPVALSDNDRRIFEAVYNTTSTATSLAARFVDKAVASAIVGINAVVHKDEMMQRRKPMQNASRHFGVSALQSTLKIVGGVVSAASLILETSRDSVIQMVHKKYGPDAGYMAEKTISSGTNVAELLVYFDATGISRRVLMSGARNVMKQSDTSSVPSKTQGNQVVFENKWFDDHNTSYKSESTDNSNHSKEKAM